MAAPAITAFGDGDHETGETGLTVDGVGFGPFADEGTLWMASNNDPNDLGTTDELPYTGGHDQQLTGVQIPSSPNNATGTVFLLYERVDGAWSDGFEFTLSAGVVSQTIGIVDETETVLSVSSGTRVDPGGATFGIGLPEATFEI